MVASQHGAMDVEDRVRLARRIYGGALPKELLSEEDSEVYERMYGHGRETGMDVDDVQAVEGEEDVRTRVLREGQDGSLEDVELEFEDRQTHVLMDDSDEMSGNRRGARLKAKKNWDDARLAGDIQASLSDEDVQDPDTEDPVDEDEPSRRNHPLTLANRFGTAPSTIQLPQASFVDPATLLLSGMPVVHLAQAAHRAFGGTGLPYSTSTPTIGKTMQARPIALDAYQGAMSDIEGDIFMACLMPGIYASVMSVLVDTRKRLGSAWAENMVNKAVAGELRILDAGGGGAGVLAVREVLRAEWERMHVASTTDDTSETSLAAADGRLGGASATPPLGTATVLTGSDALRRRASQLLENTTFIPRLPDYIHTDTAKQKGKFDIVIAPHTLWPLREDHMRKIHAQNLWSMLSTDGGVLLLLEKGVARGFELIASAREMLLGSRIANDNQQAQSQDIYEPEIDWEGDPTEPEPLTSTKEKGMIIGPCTNHKGCPMYVQRGMVKGRKDICHFQQRYTRPPFLQRIIHARDKNWEDVRFSYVAVMRGKDLRENRNENEVWDERAPVTQGQGATEQAFKGFEESDGRNGPDSLSLPRAVWPPLKRRGHVILDLCTPAGTLERWTVPRSFSKQAFRDARKSSWGDLWPLGAKTRVPRNISHGTKYKNNKADTDEVGGKSKKKKNKAAAVDPDDAISVDEYGRLTFAQVKALPPSDGGQMRRGKVKGIRDKRDKKGNGNGRLKRRMDD